MRSDIEGEVDENHHDSKARQPAAKEFSRGAMTACIVGAILVVGLAILYVITRADPATDRYAECQTLFGYDQNCKYEVSLRRLRGY